MEKDILKKASDFFAKEMKREYRVKSWSVNYYQIKTFT
jgi:arginine decarboxylase-like protein